MSAPPLVVRPELVKQILSNQVKKAKWTPEEDDTLRQHVMSMQRSRKGSWKEVADVLNRTTKQCRERWINILDPTIKRTPWTQEEMQIMFAAQRELGNKWAEISQRLPGRPETAVKNKFYAYMRAQERVNGGGKPASGEDSDGSAGVAEAKSRSLPPARHRKQRGRMSTRSTSSMADSGSEGSDPEASEGEEMASAEAMRPKPPPVPGPAFVSPLRSRPLKRPKSDLNMKLRIPEPGSVGDAPHTHSGAPIPRIPPLAPKNGEPVDVTSRFKAEAAAASAASSPGSSRVNTRLRAFAAGLPSLSQDDAPVKTSTPAGGADGVARGHAHGISGGAGGSGLDVDWARVFTPKYPMEAPSLSSAVAPNSLSRTLSAPALTNNGPSTILRPNSDFLSPTHSISSELLSPLATPGTLWNSLVVSPFGQGEGLASLDDLAAALSGDLTNDPPVGGAPHQPQPQHHKPAAYPVPPLPPLDDSLPTLSGEYNMDLL